MKTTQIVYQNQPWRNRSFKVIGVCQFDLLNPCWNGRWSKEYGPSKHWAGPDACPKCIEAASKAGQ